MDATHADFLAHDATPAGLERALGDSRSPLALKWTALHAAAEVVASLAGRAVDPLPMATQAFTPAVEHAGGWRLELARQGIDDIAAIMEPGLSALIAVRAQGGDPQAAADALWREFDQARRAVLALIHAAQELR